VLPAKVETNFDVSWTFHSARYPSSNMC